MQKISRFYDNPVIVGFVLRFKQMPVGDLQKSYFVFWYLP